MSSENPAVSSDQPSDRDVVGTLMQRLDRPIVLVGMMGVGKSSLGRRLAALLDVPFADADDEIEAAAQMTIAEIFATYDEAYFRDGERRVIARLIGETGEDGRTLRLNAAGEPVPERVKVIATGGGAFCHAQTRALILRRAIAVWLDADLDTLVERTARKDNRPLLQSGNRRDILARLKAEREGLYAEAPIHVKSGNVPHQRTMMQVTGALLDWLDAQQNPAKPQPDQS